jgi:excisionase family DNA binding protein
MRSQSVAHADHANDTERSLRVLRLNQNATRSFKNHIHLLVPERRAADFPEPSEETRGMVVLTSTDLERLLGALVRTAMREEGQSLIAPSFLTAAEVAEMLRVHPKTVVKLVKDEGLPVVRKLGRELRFERAAVVEWMRAAGRPPIRRGHLERIK